MTTRLPAPPPRTTDAVVGVKGWVVMLFVPVPDLIDVVIRPLASELPLSAAIRPLAVVPLPLVFRTTAI